MEELTIKDLLESGVHFGHQARRWNPKMKKYIFTERNGIYIIDLQKTLELIKKACDTVRKIVASGETVLFVGTKPQAADIIRDEAERSGQFYVTNRWLGGMLTNYRTIRQSIKRLEHLEKMSTDGTYELLTKKEVLSNEKHKEKLQRILGGIREMNKIPGLLIVVDTKRENIAVNEANRLGIPVCAIIDTNCDPDPIEFPIPGNDDAIRSIRVILAKITDAILEGMQMRAEEEPVVLQEAEKTEEKQKKPEEIQNSKEKPDVGEKEKPEDKNAKLKDQKRPMKKVEIPESKNIKKEPKRQAKSDVTEKKEAPKSSVKDKKVEKKTAEKKKPVTEEKKKTASKKSENE